MADKSEIPLAGKVDQTEVNPAEAARVERIHTIKFMLLAVSLFFIVPLLLYWVVTPNVAVHRELLCADIQRYDLGLKEKGSCKNTLPIDVSLTGINHGPGLQAIFDAYTEHDVLPNAQYNRYNNDKGADLCNVLPSDSAGRHVCINHKTIRFAVGTCFVLMVLATLGLYYMCRVGESNRPNTATVNLLGLESFVGWRMTIGVIWGLILAAALIWQIQVVDKLDYAHGAGQSDINVSYSDQNRLTAFGSGISKAVQIYLWIAFALWTYKTVINGMSLNVLQNSFDVEAGNKLMGPFSLSLASSSTKLQGVEMTELSRTASNKPLNFDLKSTDQLLTSSRS